MDIQDDPACSGCVGWLAFIRNDITTLPLIAWSVWGEDNLKASKDKLRIEIMQLRLIGQKMSNVCYNGSQDRLIPEEYRKLMKKLQQDWDQVERSE